VRDTRREQETPRSSDKHMLWIRDLDALRRQVTVATLDAEFGSEVAVAGLLDYADGAVRCSRVMVEVDAAGMYRYLLRLKSPAPQAQAPSQGTARGYIFPEGPGRRAACVVLTVLGSTDLPSIDQPSGVRFR
jgi:hypothetical protein